MRLQAGIAAGIALLTLGVFAQVRGHSFVEYDDPAVIVGNASLRQPLDLDAVAHHFRTPLHGNWIPLTALSLHLDRTLYGPEPAGFLLTNVALHALASIVLFLALARLTGAMGRSAFIAAIFAVHPLHVESVAWAAERKDVLSGLFWMLTLYAYAAYREKPGPGRYMGVVVAFGLGLLSKSMLVTLPFVLLLLDYWPLGRFDISRSGAGSDGESGTRSRRLDWRGVGSAISEKLPLFAMAGLVSAITLRVQESAGAMEFSFGLPLSVRLSNAATSYATYIAQSLWPFDLAVFYPLRPVPLAAALAATGLLLAITGAVVYLGRSRAYLVTGWLWYLGTLVPVIGLVQVGAQAHADRYVYIPQIGLSLVFVWGIAELADRWNLRRSVGALGVLAVLALAITSWHQVSYWRNSVALFERALSVTDSNYLAHFQLAVVLDEAGRFREAEESYTETLNIMPGSARASHALARLRGKRGKFDGSVSLYQRTLMLQPENDTARMELALLLMKLDRYQPAQMHLQRLASRHPDAPEPKAALARVLMATGSAEAAIPKLRAVLRSTPDHIDAANDLAWILATHPRESVRDPEEALRLALEIVERADANRPEYHDTLAVAYASAGQLDRAAEAAERAASLAEAETRPSLAAEIRTRREGFLQGRHYLDGTLD